MGIGIGPLLGMVAIAAGTMPAGGRIVEKAPSCRVLVEGTRVELRSPAFSLELNTARGLRASHWTNNLTGSRLALGDNPDVEFDIDAADRRIPITGWKRIDTGSKKCKPDEEHGFQVKAFLPEHDDGTWSGQTTMLLPSQKESELFGSYTWGRTHVFLPRDAGDRDVTLVLGGFGLFDYKYMRVFVNGRQIAIRRINKRWEEPGHFRLSAVSSSHSALRFGQDNVVALQLSGYVARTKELDDVDPLKLHSLENSFCWPPQFEQYVVIGRLSTTPAFEAERVETVSEGAKGEVRVHLKSTRPALVATVTYRWNAKEPVLHKFVELANAGRSSVRVLNARLGTYATQTPVTDGEQGRVAAGS